LAGVSIDRLTLQVPGCSDAEGQRLALAVANGLATAALPDGAGNVTTLQMDLTASPGVASDRLTGQIVCEILRQLERLP
jgi:hypothetical protein